MLDAAAPALAALAEACHDTELIVVPGNHDHHLADAFIDQLRLEDQNLGLEQRTDAAGHPGLLGRLAELLPGPSLSLAYPGVWLRDDVFATHGHQVDVHMTVPRPEAIMCSVMRRVTLRRAPASPADYEAIVDPLYSLFHGIAQASSQTTMEKTGGASRNVWQMLQAGGLGGFAVGRVVVPAGVLALNRAGFGPFRPEITGAELRDSGLRAMSEAVDSHGHPRRARPLRAHPPPVAGRGARPRLASQPTGALLHNTGSWYHEGSLISDAGASSPYWPGWVTWLDDVRPAAARERAERLGAMTDYSDLSAIFINCTLKRSPEPSNTKALADRSIAVLEEQGVAVETIRALDHDIATGVQPDMTEHGWDRDDWPGIFDKVMAADILVLLSPIWLGEKSSVCTQVIERLYGNSHLLNDSGQYAYYGRVGGCLITGNEDGAKHCAMNILYSLQHLGFTIPPQADSGWMGEAGPGPSYLDPGSGGPDNDFTNRNTHFMTWNLLHVARMLKDAGGIPAHGNRRDEWDAGCSPDQANPEHR